MSAKVSVDSSGGGVSITISDSGIQTHFALPYHPQYSKELSKIIDCFKKNKNCNSDIGLFVTAGVGGQTMLGIKVNYGGGFDDNGSVIHSFNREISLIVVKELSK